MELFGTLCAVVGVGTLSASFVRLVCRLDEGAKIDRTRREAEYGRSTRDGAQ